MRLAAMALAVWANGAEQGTEPCPDTTPRHAAAAERPFAVDTPAGRIAGTLAAPQGAQPAALALLLHGYTGTRDEIPVAGGAGMFARTARAFAERGIASLRIDFRGSGESAGDWADTTFDGQARDAAAAAAALAAEPGFAGLPLGALGFSQGGLVALRAAAAGAGFGRVALWNPVLDPPTTYGLIFGPSVLAEGARRAAASATPSAAGPVGASGLGPGFFAGVAAADPLADGAGLAAPVLAVMGRRDALVPDGPALAARLAARRAAPTRVLDVEAGHDLGATGAPPLLDAVIACTAAFLLAR